MNLRRIVGFAGVSGAGLCLDYGIYTLLCGQGVDAGWANLVSAAAGVTFVFLVSVRHVFESGDHFLGRLFVVYAAYQVVAVGVASYGVDAMTALLDGRYLLGKTAVVPFSFVANYVFMSWLLGARGRSGPAAVWPSGT